MADLQKGCYLNYFKSFITEAPKGLINIWNIFDGARGRGINFFDLN